MKICDKCGFELVEGSNKMRIERRKGIWYFVCQECSDIYMQGLIKLEVLYHDLFFQPDRSKREDLCCEDLKIIQEAYETIHGEYCYTHQCSYISEDFCKRLNSMIQRYKMRCSEHCGNTVREVQ
jgi:hypothetical protein